MMKCPFGVLAVVLLFFSPAAAFADAYQGNSQKLAKRYPLQYESWLHSLDSSEEPDPGTPANPAQMIIYGAYYKYRDLVAGKRSHANGMIEVYTSIGGDVSYLQRCLPCHSSDAPGLYKRWGDDALSGEKL
jgi:formate-dependent nitrite reductase cytochrome c552 subunit